MTAVVDRPFDVDLRGLVSDEEADSLFVEVERWWAAKAAADAAVVEAHDRRWRLKRQIEHAEDVDALREASSELRSAEVEAQDLAAEVELMARKYVRAVGQWGRHVLAVVDEVRREAAAEEAEVARRLKPPPTNGISARRHADLVRRNEEIMAPAAAAQARQHAALLVKPAVRSVLRSVGLIGHQSGDWAAECRLWAEDQLR